MKSLVSIVIPVYNVSAFVEKCMRSLMLQSYPEIEFLIVDDASTDDSMELIDTVLSEFPTRKNQVRIIQHVKNKGLPAARNTGLAQAKGEYIFHCDSDDWMDSSMIADMMEVACRENATIVYTDFYLTFAKNERYMHQPSLNSPKACLHAMLNGSMKYNVWNKLIKHALYKEYAITFPAGNGMGEDMTIMKLFCHADKVVFLPKAYYHYMQTNPNAYTKNMSDLQLAQIAFNANHLIDYLKQTQIFVELDTSIQYFKLNTKMPFLISTEKKMYAVWRSWFPEANPFIAQNPAFSMRIRLLQYAAIKQQDWLILFYNKVIIKLVYGVIYR